MEAVWRRKTILKGHCIHADRIRVISIVSCDFSVYGDDHVAFCGLQEVAGDDSSGNRESSARNKRRFGCGSGLGGVHDGREATEADGICVNMMAGGQLRQADRGISLFFPATMLTSRLCTRAAQELAYRTFLRRALLSCPVAAICGDLRIRSFLRATSRAVTNR